MPCATQPGDIVGLVLEGSGGAPAGGIVVFGQAFRPGDLPRGASLAARLAADGRPLRCQLDATTHHPDGSVRFGMISLAAPALGAGERAGAVLSAAAARDAAPAAGALDLAAALGGRQAVVEMAPVGSREVWRADLIVLLRAAMAERAARPWQSGPLAVQWRIVQPVPEATAGGVTSLRLIADLSARADGTLWADVWLRNDVAMRPGGGLAAYSMRVLLDGREALRAERLRQFQYTGWGRLLGSAGRETAAPAPPLVRPDIAYLTEAGAIARYDLSTGVAGALLARLGAATATDAWAAPLGAREVTQAMPTTGGRPDIGPTTEAQAVWLISGDRRAATYALGQAEAAGAVPWHLWDPSGGAQDRGGWMDTRHWPRLWVDYRGGPPPTGLLQPVAGDTGWQPDDAHQPDLAFVPYLLTGRRAFLDELQAQAAWCVMRAWPSSMMRGEPGATGLGDGVNVVRGGQVRGGAWSLRQLDEAAWISPDEDANRPWLVAAAAGNWSWLRAQLPEWTTQQGEAHGWMPIGYSAAGGLGRVPPWENDFFASTAATASRRGNADARAVLAWMGNFLAGRFLSDARGFSRYDGVAYQIAVAPEGPRGAGPPFRTWREIGAATRAHGLSIDRWDKADGFSAQFALASLAALRELIGGEEAARAYDTLLASGATMTRTQDFREFPKLNIVPRGMPRVPGSAPRCAPAAAGR